LNEGDFAETRQPSANHPGAAARRIHERRIAPEATRTERFLAPFPQLT
jgi:hypothetical protein